MSEWTPETLKEHMDLRFAEQAADTKEIKGLIREAVAEFRAITTAQGKAIKSLDEHRVKIDTQLGTVKWLLRIVAGVATALIVLFLTGCAAPPPEWTPPAPPTETAIAPTEVEPPATALPPDTETPPPAPTSTPSPPPTATLAPTATATALPAPTDTPTAPPVPQVEEIAIPIVNPGFEGAYYADTFGNIFVATGWRSWYCADPYTAGCPATPWCDVGQTVGCNPVGTAMGRPEYNPQLAAQYPNRVHGGSAAQHWFCFSRACWAGVYQPVTIPPGWSVCTVEAYVQSWSNNTTNTTYTSDLGTQDARRNSTWTIAVDFAGGANAFANGVQVGHGYGYDWDIYDNWAWIGYTFDVPSGGGPLTIFIGDRRLWPFKHNDSYIDDVRMTCARMVNPPTPTPTPTPIAPIPGEPTPTQIGELEPLGQAVVIASAVNIRQGPLPFSTAAPIGQLHQGDTFDVWEIQAYRRDTGEYQPFGACGCSQCNVWLSNSVADAWWVAMCYNGNRFVNLYGPAYLPG